MRKTQTENPSSLPLHRSHGCWMNNQFKDTDMKRIIKLLHYLNLRSDLIFSAEVNHLITPSFLALKMTTICAQTGKNIRINHNLESSKQPQNNNVNDSNERAPAREVYQERERERDPHTR